MCDNCFVDHNPEDCIIDGPISDCNIDTIDLVSFSDGESNEADIISITDTEPYMELLTPAVGAGDIQPVPTPSLASDDEEAPHAITLQQVMMTAPVETSSAPTTSIMPNTSGTWRSIASHQPLPWPRSRWSSLHQRHLHLGTIWATSTPSSPSPGLATPGAKISRHPE